MTFASYIIGTAELPVGDLPTTLNLWGYQILHPWLLLLIVPVFLGLIVQLFKKPPTLRVSSIDHFTDGSATHNKKLYLNRLQIPNFLEFIALLLLIVSAARPQKGIEKVYSTQDGIDILLTLDLSASMKYYDAPEEDSPNAVARKIEKKELGDRLAVAKAEIVKFIDKRPADRIGLVIFGVEAFSVAPPSLDHDYLKSEVERLSIENLKEFSQGTNISSGLAKAVSKIKKSPSKRKIMILFSDGAQTAESEYTPTQIAGTAADFKITIHTIGIGGRNSYAVVDHPFGGRRLQALNGQDNSFDAETLKEIAEKTEGRYFQAKDQESFDEVMTMIDQLEKVPVKKPRYVNYKEVFLPFLLTALGLLALSFITTNSVFQRVP